MSATPATTPQSPPHTRARLRFDRGTLVFDTPPPPELVAGLGVSWDDRTREHRAPPWRYVDLVRRARALGLELVDDVVDFTRLPSQRFSPIELRPYQQAALDVWTQSRGRGLVVLPTGAGKTRLAIAAIAACRVSTLCLVPTRVLMHQWRHELTQFYRGKIGVWGDGEREVAPLMVSTFESGYRHMSRWGARFPLLVVDEAHHFGLTARDELLEMSVAPFRLGLTATPPDDDALARIGQLIGPLVFRQSVQELSGSYLADFDVVVHRVPLSRDERAAYEDARQVFQRYHRVFRRLAPTAPWGELIKTANQSPEGRAALTAWRQSRRIVESAQGKSLLVGRLLREHRDGRTIVFTGDNASAYAISERHLVAPITCDISRTERDEVLARFRAGEVRAIVSARVLNEGVDVPDADVAIITGSTHGKREHVQRVGRLLRPRPGKRATVHEIIAEGTHEVRQAETRRLGLL